MRRACILYVTLVVAACGGGEPPAKAPPAPETPKDPPWLAPAARACALAATCSPRVPDPGTCVDQTTLRGQDALGKCLVAAKTCTDVDVCLRGGGDAKAAAFCGERGVVSGCDGERLVSCADDAHDATVVDCAALGATCKENRAAGGVVTRGCFSAQKCPAGAPDARCEGNTVVTCQNGAVERTVCGPGTECAVRGTETACVLPGGIACGLHGTRRCDRGRLVECRAGSAHVVDCAGMGLDCTGVGPRAACTVRTDMECNKDMLPKCEGSTLVFCAAGRLSKIPCASLGMGACDPAARGAKAACALGPAK
jgi:hypothetical protein